MWKKTTGWLFEVQKRNGILEEKDRRLYEYAYGVLLAGSRYTLSLSYLASQRGIGWRC